MRFTRLHQFGLMLDAYRWHLRLVMTNISTHCSLCCDKHFGDNLICKWILCGSISRVSLWRIAGLGGSVACKESVTCAWVLVIIVCFVSVLTVLQFPWEVIKFACVERFCKKILWQICWSSVLSRDLRNIRYFFYFNFCAFKYYFQLSTKYFYSNGKRVAIKNFLILLYSSYLYCMILFRSMEM